MQSDLESIVRPSLIQKKVVVWNRSKKVFWKKTPTITAKRSRVLFLVILGGGAQLIALSRNIVQVNLVNLSRNMSKCWISGGSGLSDRFSFIGIGTMWMWNLQNQRTIFWNTPFATTALKKIEQKTVVKYRTTRLKHLCFLCSKGGQRDVLDVMSFIFERVSWFCQQISRHSLSVLFMTLSYVQSVHHVNEPYLRRWNRSWAATGELM